MSEIYVTLPFGGEDRRFGLPLGQIRAVQTKCDAGPSELLRRYWNQTYRVDDVREVIFQGLVGGGMDQAAATRLVIDTFDGQPLGGFVLIAEAIMSACIAGVKDDDLGEPEGEAGTSDHSPGASSSSVSSTASAPSPAASVPET